MLGGTFKFGPSYLYICSKLMLLSAVIQALIFLASIPCFPTNPQQRTRDFPIFLKIILAQILPHEHTSSISRLRLSRRLNKYFHDYLLGAVFHLTRSVRRKVQNVGLVEEFKNSDDVRNAAKSLSSLAYLEIDEINEDFEELQECSENMNLFL